MIHTKTGGPKNIVLKNGKKVSLNMEPETTVYLDCVTGNVALK
jgi:hypothetical protein